MKLTNEQVQILKDCKIEENRIYLQWQLDRKQYVSINEVLETIWAKWNRWKKAHIVEWMTQEDIENAFEDIFQTGEVETLKETIKKFQFYPTPKEVAEYLVELAEIKKSDNILEPSAGLGDIANLIIEQDFNAFELCELDSIKCEELRNRWYRVYECDFLSFCPDYRYSKIIANPPFSKSQDVKHILHMYKLLSEWGRIVSIASSSIKTREWKLYDELRALNPEFIELPEWSFKEIGTMVNTVIVLICK